MDDSVLLWLARLGALLCAAGAAWTLGRTVPGWQGDDHADSFSRSNRGMGAGGYEDAGCGPMLVGTVVAWFRGSPLGILLLGAAIVCSWFGWPLDPDTFVSGQTGGGRGLLFILLFNAGFWLPLLAGIGGYVGSVVVSERRNPRG